MAEPPAPEGLQICYSQNEETRCRDLLLATPHLLAGSAVDSFKDRLLNILHTAGVAVVASEKHDASNTISSVMTTPPPGT